jgi:hypothetical protein
MKFEFRQKIHTLTPPKSMATCLDFVSIWSSDINRAKFTRLCAAAIAVCAPNGIGLPSYDISQSDPVSFGHGATDALLNGGCTISNIYTIGGQLLADMAKTLPNDDEVEQAENFTVAGADHLPATV